MSFADDGNRIILRPIRGHSDCQREFINACYIDVSDTFMFALVHRDNVTPYTQGYKFENKFIATQGEVFILSKLILDTITYSVYRATAKDKH